MKNLYKFLSMMLLFLVGTASSFAAEDRDWTQWTASDDQITAPADGMYVILQQGNNGAGWSSNAYLSTTGSWVKTVDATAIYQLEQTGTASDGQLIFALKSVSEGQYISTSGEYTIALSDAFQCTIMKAVTSSEDARCLIKGGDTQTDADGSDWVLAYKESNDDGSYSYLCYWGCPAISSYHDTNNWRIYEAIASQPTVDEKIQVIYNELFKDGFDATLFPVGTGPGCVSQELYDQLSEAYDAANATVGIEGKTDEERQQVLDQILAAQAAYEAGVIGFEEGKYYMFVNQRSQDAMYDTGGSVKCKGSKSTLSDPLTAADAPYIWTVEDAGDGMYYIKNFSTSRYIKGQSSTSSQFPTTTTAQTKFAIERNKSVSGIQFTIIDEDGNQTHNDGGMNVVKWNDKSATGGLWIASEVPAEQVQALIAVVEKNRFMAKYNTLIEEAKATQMKHLYDSDVTFDDQYDSSKPGLVTAIEKANATEPSEGSEAELFDSNTGTYYHTLWSSNITDDYHWIQVSLGDEEVQNFFLKMTQRHNNRRGNPSIIALVAQADGDDPDGAWTDTLYKDTVIYQYTTNFASGTIANTTSVKRISLSRGVTKLRFVGLRTVANQLYSYGPCWHLSELRFYKDNGDNPRYLMIPEEVRNALSTAITNAETLASDSSATEADYEALAAAIKAFNNAYPDDSELQSLIESAKTRAQADGLIGDAWGYFPAEAQTDLSTAISSVETAIEGKTLTLDEINTNLATLRAAIATFNSRLNVPADGTIVRIVSASMSAEGEEQTAYGNVVYAENADTTANISWGLKEDANLATRPNTLWQLNRLDNGNYLIRNVVTGRYIANPYTGVSVDDIDEVDLSNGLVSTSSTKNDGIALVSAAKGGVFNLQLAEGCYANTDPTGAIVNWNDYQANSYFTLEEVSGDILGDGYTIDVEADKWQIVTMPVTLAYCDPLPYKVLGQKDGLLQLKMYTDDEEIPAGTPFIVKTGEDETFLQAGLAYTSAADLLKAEDGFEYGHKIQNGLVGTTNALVLPASLGTLVDGMVKLTVKNTAISAGSGYFTVIPETTEEGEMTLDINGTIVDGISAATLVKKVSSDVYTLSGVKIRSNVSGAAATNGLPKGLYIVNGKTVLVK